MRPFPLLIRLSGTFLAYAAISLGVVSPVEAVMATLDVVQPGQRSMDCGGNVHGLTVDFESMDEPLDSMSIQGLESLQGCFNSLGWNRHLEVLSDYVTVIPGIETRHWVLVKERVTIPAGDTYYRRVFTFDIDGNGRIISFNESAIEEFAPLAIQGGMSMANVQEVLLNLNPNHDPFTLETVFTPQGEEVEPTQFIQDWTDVVGLTLWPDYQEYEMVAHVLDNNTFVVTWEVDRGGIFTESAVVMNNPEGVWVSAPLNYLDLVNPQPETPQEHAWHVLRAMGYLDRIVSLLPPIL
jgi:hypothetical protein